MYTILVMLKKPMCVNLKVCDLLHCGKCDPVTQGDPAFSKFQVSSSVESFYRGAIAGHKTPISASHRFFLFLDTNRYLDLQIQ